MSDTASSSSVLACVSAADADWLAPLTPATSQRANRSRCTGAVRGSPARSRQIPSRAVRPRRKAAASAPASWPTSRSASKYPPVSADPDYDGRITLGVAARVDGAGHGHGRACHFVRFTGLHSPAAAHASGRAEERCRPAGWAAGCRRGRGEDRRAASWRAVGHLCKIAPLGGEREISVRAVTARP